MNRLQRVSVEWAPGTKAPVQRQRGDTIQQRSVRGPVKPLTVFQMYLRANGYGPWRQK